MPYQIYSVVGASHAPTWKVRARVNHRRVGEKGRQEYPLYLAVQGGIDYSYLNPWQTRGPLISVHDANLIV